MTDVVFAFPNFLYSGPSVTFPYHYGTGFLRASLAQDGIDTAQFVTDKPLTVPQIVSGILEYSPQIVGFASYDTGAFLVHLISQQLKQRNPRLKILVGGPCATFNDQELLEMCPDVDVVVRGEAEETCSELVPRLLSDVDLSDVNGITYRSSTGITRNPDRRLRAGEHGALDIYPSPYLRGVIPASAAFEVGLSTSRGCKGVCAYCQFPALFKFRFRTFSLERIFHEIDLLVRHHGRNHGRCLNLWDDDLAADLDRLAALCEGIICRGIQMPFKAELRGDHIDLAMLRMLKSAGMSRIHFGLESANPTTLRRIMRIPQPANADPELSAEHRYLDSIRRAVRLAQSIGIKASVSVILGLPGETLEDANRTLEFVRAMRVDGYQHNVFWALKGTAMWSWAKDGKWGLGIEPPDVPYKLFSTKHPYDTSKVRRLSNAIWEDKGTDLGNVIAGTFESRSEWEDSFRFLMLLNAKQPQPSFMEWSRDNLRLSSTVYLQASNVTWKDITSASNDAYRKYRSAFINYHGISEHTNDDCDLGKRDLSDQRVSHTLRMPYSEAFNESRQSASAWPQDELLVLEIESVADLRLAANHSSSLSSGVTVPRWMLARKVIVKDLCRWSKQRFPCQSLQRAVVTIDLHVKTCTGGAVLGNIYDRGGDLRQSLSSSYESAIRARDCQACPVKDECSQCPFVFPFSPEE